MQVCPMKKRDDGYFIHPACCVLIIKQLCLNEMHPLLFAFCRNRLIQAINKGGGSIYYKVIILWYIINYRKMKRHGSVDCSYPL